MKRKNRGENISPRSRSDQSPTGSRESSAKLGRAFGRLRSSRHRAGGRPRETPGRPAEVSPGPRERGRGPAARGIPRRASPRRSARARPRRNAPRREKSGIESREKKATTARGSHPGTGRVATREPSPVPVWTLHLRQASRPSPGPASSPRRARACPPRRCPRRFPAGTADWFGSRRARLRRGRPARPATRAPCPRDRPGEARGRREGSRGSARTAGRTLAVVARARVWLRAERGAPVCVAERKRSSVSRESRRRRGKKQRMDAQNCVGPNQKSAVSVCERRRASFPTHQRLSRFVTPDDAARSWPARRVRRSRRRRR